jgi:hypothetical protein
MKKLFRIYILFTIFINFFNCEIQSANSKSIYLSTIFSALASSLLSEQIKNIGIFKDDVSDIYKEKIMWKKCLCDYRDLLIYDEAFISFFNGLTKEILEKATKNTYCKEYEKIFGSYFNIFSAIISIFKERRALLKSITDVPKKALCFFALFGVVKGSLSLWLQNQIKQISGDKKISKMFLNIGAIGMHNIFVEPLLNFLSLFVCFKIRGNRFLYNLEGDKKAADKIINNFSRCFDMGCGMINLLK